MRRVHVPAFFLITLFLFFIPAPSSGAELSLIKSLEKTLERSRVILERAEQRLRSGYSIHSELSELKILLEEVKASHLLLQERFRAMEEEMRSHGEKALTRHRVMVEGYSQALLEYIALIESLSSDGITSLSRIESLLILLNKILPPTKKPIFGSLPYRNLKYPAQEPNSSPPIRPAYRGGDKRIRPDDLKGTTEAPISYEIAMLAQSLNWNPVSIYEWVKNNIETEWYWGSMKGAGETLRQRSGNDCDQASLLIALLRASGYPSRYVRGTIEFFPDIERAKNLFGIDEPQRIAEYLQKAGVPFKAIISGGRITNLQIEHIWVETYVPYANYRGAILDEHGKTWLGLDTSIKVSGYAYNTPADIPDGISLANLREEYLGAIHAETPLQYLKAYINSQLTNRPQPITYDDLLRTRALIPEVMNILPASLQFRQTRITHEYSELPEELKHRVRFIATADPNKELFETTLDASRLSNQKIALTYEPESREDQEIIHAYGGLDNTPAYLIRLRPVLTLNGERVVAGRDGLPMGKEYELIIEILSPGGAERITNTPITGNFSVIGIVSQNASLIMNEAEGEKNAEQLLYEEALRYIGRWNQAEEELASLMRLVITRPIPTVVNLGGVIDVTYLLDTPHGFEWKGLYVDADLRAVETVRSSEFGVRSENQKLFMELSSLHGSILENRLFEEDFKVESISTAKLFGLTRSTQPVTEILTIDKSNIASVLPTLPFDQNIKEDIENSVNQNLTIRIPKSEIIYEDWAGIGYIKENPETGESGYMLSGMIAGGMTVWEKGKWQSLADILMYPYTEPSNKDPLSAREIKKLPGGDLQSGVVGEILPKQLQVKVTDSAGKGVPNVEVIFRIKAGGGKLIDLEAEVIEEFGWIIKRTKGNGIAGVHLRLGTITKDSPAFLKIDPADRYYTQVGENIVEVTLKASGIKTLKPFTAYGKPGEVKNVELRNLGNQKGDILSYVGPVSIILSDQKGNPVANKPVDFIFQGIKNLGSCKDSEDVPPPQLLTPDYPCAKRPLYGCGTDKSLSGVLTDSAGSAMVGIILGAIPNAEYLFIASHKTFQVDFKRTSHPFGNCSGDADPSIKLQLDSYYSSDAYGHNLNAARSGKTIPLEAFLYFLKEGDTKKRLNLSCDDKLVVCDKIVGDQTYKHDFDSSRSWVWFGDVPGAPLGGGVFRTDYKLKPGINSIPIKGTGEASVKRTIPCPNCVTSSTTLTLSQNLLALAYGVDITIDPLAPVLIENVTPEGTGYSATDLSVRYTIHPSQYTALSAYVDLIEDGEVIGRVAAEKSGTGSATFSQGFPFNLNRKYEIQVVLNPGTGVEIKSDKKKVAVAQLSVLQDVLTYPIADEIGYGDGTIPERRYRIQIRSRTYSESCPSYGVIRVVDRKGETIVTPSGTDYYFPEYGLEFTRMSGQCLVKVIDTTAGSIPKDKFILSNRSRDALKEKSLLLEDIAVLYGGMGNVLEIEIDGMRKQWPIEPVGIVLIGIDGLRQDVLYQGDLDDVKDGGKYWVNIKELAGIKQILEGFDQPIENRKYVMLPKVTAIFPSITKPSWASIFTGKMPNETGIVGNEFFARDLAGPAENPVPGMKDAKIPPGMVSLDAGSFLPGNAIKIPGIKIVPEIGEFTLRHGIPAEIPGFGFNTTLKKKIDASAPLFALKAKTIFEEIKEGQEGVWKNLKGRYRVDANSRCDQTQFECSTAAVFDYYPKGADWWVTPNASMAGDFATLLSLFDLAKAMDKGASVGAISFIEDYFSRKNPDGKRKRFPAVFSVYFSGLDHYAHGEGMAGYSNFFKNITDLRVRDLVNVLKRHGEFDNKIFIIVSDHGMTEMPTNLKYRDKNWLGFNVDKDAEMSCSLKLDFVDPENPDHITSAQKAELANNNLHIWELAEVLRGLQEKKPELNYRVLAPKEISELFIDSPAGARKNLNPQVSQSDFANLIAAFNGPMAHIYLRGLQGWDTYPSRKELINLAKALRVLFQIYDPDEAQRALGIDPVDYLNLLENKVGRLEQSVDKILVRLDGEYFQFDGDGSVNRMSFDLEYVNAGDRIQKLNHPQRSGDIILIMRDKITGNVDKRYTVGTACKAWHGSLNRSDSYVPFIIAYPGGNKLELDPVIKDTRGCSLQGCDGNWRVTDMIKTIIKKQYPSE